MSINKAASFSVERQTTTCDIPSYLTFRFELGAALFVGWGGAILLIAGGTVLGYFSGKEGLKSR